MTIDENIDLTLPAWFARDDNPELMLTSHFHYLNNEEDIFSSTISLFTRLPGIREPGRNMHFDYFENKEKEELIQSSFNLCYSLFNTFPEYINEVDPYLHYRFGTRGYCDCCGCSINLLNSANSYYLCVDCNSNLNHKLKSIEL